MSISIPIKSITMSRWQRHGGGYNIQEELGWHFGFVHDIGQCTASTKQLLFIFLPSRERLSTMIS